MPETLETNTSRLNGEGTALLAALEQVVKKIAPDEAAMSSLIDRVIGDRIPRVLQVRTPADLKLGQIAEHVRSCHIRSPRRLA